MREGEELNSDIYKDTKCPNKSTECGERMYSDYIMEARAAYAAAGGQALADLLAKKQGDYTAEDYYALPEDCRVELIDGVIYNMAAPTLEHQTVVFRIAVQLDEWIRRRKGRCMVMISPADVQLDRDERTMVQPDVFVVCAKKTGAERGDGRTEAEEEPGTKVGTAPGKRTKADRNPKAHHAFHGAPDFVAEVLSPSSEGRDRGIKYRKYKNAGVKEYWMVDPEAETVTVHKLDHGETAVYTYQDEIPVHIFDGGCRITLENIRESGRILDELGGL